MAIADSMVLCAKICPSILNSDLSDLVEECLRLLDQVKPIPVLFSGTKFFRYRFRDFFPVPNFSVGNIQRRQGAKVGKASDEEDKVGELYRSESEGGEGN